jgi:predicted DNA-binding transcriptional regulator AlpA
VFTINKVTSEGFLPARSVWERYGVTSMTLYRWLADERTGFPKPIYLGRFRYWKIADLVAWEASRPNTGTPVGAARMRASQSAEAA